MCETVSPVFYVGFSVTVFLAACLFLVGRSKRLSKDVKGAVELVLVPLLVISFAATALSAYGTSCSL
jgi:hypothetical protein